MDRKSLQDLVNERNSKREPLAKISRQSDTQFLINDHKYELIENHDDGFQLEDFINRFSPDFSQFDYIVGDWGYGQLRLTGFYADDRKNTDGPFISQFQNYLLENINFGAAYFIVHNLEAKPIPHKNKRAEKKHPSNSNNSKRGNASKRKSSSNNNRHAHHFSSKNNHNNRPKKKHSFVEQKVQQKKSVPKHKDVIVEEAKTKKHRFVIKEKK